MPSLSLSAFHRSYYRLLDLFAKGEIRRLMVSVPPQHGKSMGASNLLPAYLLGLDRSLSICIGSYSFSLARRFGAGVQRIIASESYQEIFPESFLKGMKREERGSGSVRSADEFELVGADGGLRLVGREGSLTGNRVDVMILDDLYKDAMEANSPLIRDNAWEWYTSVVRTRMHNDSREIMVFTRWHEEDLMGAIRKREPVVELNDLAQVSSIDRDSWVCVNFEALKTTPPSALDPRRLGEPLWPERHSERLLIEKRRLDPVVFEALYQGAPSVASGLLYTRLDNYNTLPGDVTKIGCYVDSADTGTDKLCAICYVRDLEGLIYLIDVVYSDLPMEQTELMVADMLVRNGVREALVESNNGGRGFARVLQRRVHGCRFTTFHQGANKESRILTNASTVCELVKVPCDWRSLWPDFANDLLTFRRNFRTNRHDDAPDALTGVVESEVSDVKHRIRHVGFTC